MKRIVSLCLTLVMVFSLPTMAFATSSSVKNINDDAVVFLDILTSFQSYDPHSMCASYKENQYVHKNKGAFVTLEKSVLMYDMELWPQADYAGTSVSRIAYKVTLWENGEA